MGDKLDKLFEVVECEITQRKPPKKKKQKKEKKSKYYDCTKYGMVTKENCNYCLHQETKNRCSLRRKPNATN